MISVRADAAQLVGRVLRQGAYSNVLVGQAAVRYGGSDRAMVARLVYGTLRYLRRIDRALTSASSRPLAKIQPEVLDCLRVGSFEILFGGSPTHAAVDEGVEAVRQVAGERPVAFANGVLRALARQGEPVFSEDDAALRHNVSDWQFQELASAWGKSDAEAFFAASMQPAPLTVLARQRGDPVPGAPVPGIAGAYEVEAVPEDGDFLVIDPASVAVVQALELLPGMLVLDMAAAPGGKTIQIADKGARTIAMDRHERRVGRGIRRTRTASVDVHWLVADGLRPPFAQRTFDRVLLDAPCTGFGTLRRRPEIKHRLTEDAPARMGRIQRGLVDAGLKMVKPGGRLVYSVCTIFAAETTDIVNPVGGKPPDGLPGRQSGGGLLLAPHLTGTDGMFISVIEVPG